MLNSPPDSNREFDWAVIGPHMLKLRDSLQTLTLGLQDVLFELDIDRRNEVVEQVCQLLESAKIPRRTRNITD